MLPLAPTRVEPILMIHSTANLIACNRGLCNKTVYERNFSLTLES